MKHLFLMAALLGGVAITSTAAIADSHSGDYKKGKMMEKVDTDGDGMVSMNEFMAKHEAMFNRMDANGDGLLSKDEMKDARGKMKEKREKMKEMKESSGY